MIDMVTIADCDTDDVPCDAIGERFNMHTAQQLEQEKFFSVGSMRDVVTPHKVRAHTIWEMSDAAYVTHLAQLSDGAFVAGYHDGLIKVKDATTEKIFYSTHSKLLSLLVLKNGQILSSHENGRTYFWDEKTGEVTAKLFTGRVASSLEMPDGTLVMGLRGSNIIFINPMMQQKFAQIGTPSLHIGDMLALLVTGELLSARRDTGALFFWDIETQQRKKCFRTHPDLYALAVLSDGEHVATSHRDGKIYVWSINEERCVMEFSHHRTLIHTLIALPNGMLAAGDAEGNIKFWDVYSQQCIATVSVLKTRLQLVYPTYVGHLVFQSNQHLSYMTNHEIGFIDLAELFQSGNSSTERLSTPDILVLEH